MPVTLVYLGSQFWFDNQMFKNKSFQNLLTLCKYFPKVTSFVKSSWCRELSLIETQQSNICVEGAVEVMQSHVEKTLNLKYLLTNIH